MIEIINRAFKKIQCADYASPQGEDALLYLESKRTKQIMCNVLTTHSLIFNFLCKVNAGEMQKPMWAK